MFWIGLCVSGAFVFGAVFALALCRVSADADRRVDDMENTRRGSEWW